jgi:hypothetical protein
MVCEVELARGTQDVQHVVVHTLVAAATESAGSHTSGAGHSCNECLECMAMPRYDVPIKHVLCVQAASPATSLCDVECYVQQLVHVGRHGTNAANRHSCMSTEHSQQVAASTLWDPERVHRTSARAMHPVHATSHEQKMVSLVKHGCRQPWTHLSKIWRGC